MTGHFSGAPACSVITSKNGFPNFLLGSLLEFRVWMGLGRICSMHSSDSKAGSCRSVRQADMQSLLSLYKRSYYLLLPPGYNYPEGSNCRVSQCSTAPFGTQSLEVLPPLFRRLAWLRQVGVGIRNDQQHATRLAAACAGHVCSGIRI